MTGVEIVEVEWLPSANGGPPKFQEKPGSEQVRGAGRGGGAGMGRLLGSEGGIVLLG